MGLFHGCSRVPCDGPDSIWHEERTSRNSVAVEERLSIQFISETSVSRMFRVQTCNARDARTQETCDR